MIRTSVQQLSTSVATQLSIDDTIQSSNTLVIQNINSSGYIYIGNEEVSTSNYGFKIYPAQSISIELMPFDRIWAVSSDSNLSVATMIIERLN